MKKYYHRFINYITTKRIAKAKIDFQKIEAHPIRSGIFTFIISFMIIVIFVGVLMISTPAFKNFAEHVIDKCMSYTDAVDTLNKRMNNIENMTQNVADSIVEKITKTRKNPDLNGIQISGGNLLTIQPSCKSGLSVIYLSDVDNNEIQLIINNIIEWAEKSKHDAVIFGSMYVGLNGTLYWSDGINPKYDTDMELIINVLKKKGCKNILIFSPNRDQRTFSNEIKYISSSIVVKNVQMFKYKVPFTNIWFIKDGFKTILCAENFHAELYKNDFKVLIKPGKNNQPKVLVNQHEKKVVNSVRNKIRNGLKTSLQWGIKNL